MLSTSENPEIIARSSDGHMLTMTASIRIVGGLHHLSCEQAIFSRQTMAYEAVWSIDLRLLYKGRLVALQVIDDLGWQQHDSIRRHAEVIIRDMAGKAGLTALSPVPVH